MLSSRRVVLSLAVLIACWSAGASAQTLAREGDHFTYNALPRFLVFVSYFDGLRASDATLDSDFQYLRSRGIDGIRVMANWWERGVGGQYANDTLVKANGDINLGTYGRLRALLDKARQYNLAVDLTFTFDTVLGGSRDSEVTGINTVNSWLSDDGYANVLVDVQNEWPKWFGSGEVVPLRNAVSGRLAAASTTDGYEVNAAISAAQEQGVDTIAYHEIRTSGWWNLTDNYVQALRGPGLPVYFQESPKYYDAGGATADNFITAVTNAKAAGAAAWNFHTHAGSDLSGGQSMQSRLAGVESDFLNRFRSAVDGTSWGAQVESHRAVNLRSWNGPYMVAENGGGGDVNANRPDAGAWETFTLHDLNGGELQDGDAVTFQTDNPNFYLQAEGGGSPTARMLAIGGGEWAWETFAIVNLTNPGRAIGSGDQIALRSEHGYHAVAEGGGGGVVNVNRSGIGAWETWTLIVR